MRLSDFLFDCLANWGVDQAFCVTGGAAMFLNDALGGHPDIDVLYMHNEQSCAMAAEAYARIAGKPAIVCVTAGPGFLNALNGIAGAFTDSIPMIVVAGQVKRETLSDSMPGLRQFGDQEVHTSPIASDLCKVVIRVTPEDVGAQLVDAYHEAISGRPGPVVLEVPLDVQSYEFSQTPEVAPPSLTHTEVSPQLEEKLESVVNALASAKRPLILAGSGVRISGTTSELIDFAEKTFTPVATAWTHDTIESSHPLFAGRPGTIGTRPGNFALQAADFVLVLGSRLNIRQTGYNFDAFAKQAKVFWIDVDWHELEKNHLRIEERIEGDLRAVLPLLNALSSQRSFSPRTDWLDWIHSLRKYEPQASDYQNREEGINPYHFVMELSERIPVGTIVACGDATACIVPFQVMGIKRDMRLFSNSGIASMGYDLPAAIGAALASEGKAVVGLAGDGSIMMNLQELATLSALPQDILLFILENDGYLSIKQTQRNFFGRAYGADPMSGVPFPDFEVVAAAFGLPVLSLRYGTDWTTTLDDALSMEGPRIAVVHLDPAQEFEPRIKSRREGTTLVSPALDDMYPFLDRDQLDAIRLD